MKVIMMEVGKPAEVKDIDGSLDGMQKIVGGWIQSYYPFEDEDVAIILNEEGKIIGLPANRVVYIHGYTSDILCGPAFIVGSDPNLEDFSDLTDEQIERLMKKIDISTIKC